MQRSIRCMDMNIELLNSDSIDLDVEYCNRVMFDKGICDSVASILNYKDMTIKQLELCLSQDPSLISFIMYDNTLQLLPKCDRLVGLRRVLNAYTSTSMMETSMFAKNDWLLNDICNLYRCGTIKQCLGNVCVSVDQINYTTITTRASNYYNTIKRIGEQESLMNISFYALQRYAEIESPICSNFRNGQPRKHKEDSAINNFMKKVYKSDRVCERRRVTLMKIQEKISVINNQSSNEEE